MNATGTRTAIIISPSGRKHAARSTLARGFVRRLGWRVTLCGQIAELGWSQRIAYGYVDCRTCLGVMERR
jgi:hypothetical protein